jgi:3-deoxy-D-manno-octulosonic-acid transferase
MSRALLVLVPRHPERFADVVALCQAGGWTVQRRSSGLVPGPETAIVVGDTMGELVLLLGTADIAIIGGSLVEHGGHNALEAAAWGVPVIAGPHMFNFQEISRLLLDAGAMIQLGQPGELAEALIELALDPQRRAAMGSAGERVVRENRGAREQLLQLVAGLLAS